MNKQDKIELILDGLATDGSHHKQWYLEQILKSLVIESKFSKLKEEEDWDDGIPP